MQPKRVTRDIITICFFCIMAGGLTNIAGAAGNPTVAPAGGALPAGTEYSPYATTLTGSGGTPPYTWSVTTGVLPAGLSLANQTASTIDISGTPIASCPAGTPCSFTVTLTDSKAPFPKTATANYTVVLPPRCIFAGTSAGSIAFTTIDPSTSPGPVTNTVTQQIFFECDASLAYSFTTVPVNPTLVLGANSIPFTLGLAAPGLNVTNTTQVPLLTATSSILQANYANAVAGLYSTTGSIGITLNWTGPTTGSLSATATAAGTVINACAVSQSAGTLTFNMDPSISGTTTAAISQDLKIKCTKNDPIALTAASACGALCSTYPPVCGGSTIPYSFTFLSSATGAGFTAGNDISLGIGGSASSVNYVNSPVGTYGDKQTITVNY